MTDDANGYDLRAIRSLLLGAFRAEELRRFCQDRPDLRPIINRFSSGQGLEERVDHVIDYCEEEVKFDLLLSTVRGAKPQRYGLHGPYVLGSSLPDRAMSPGESPKTEGREITHPVLLVYSSEDKILAGQLIDQFTDHGLAPLPAPWAVSSRLPQDLVRLEDHVRRCQTALILLSETMLLKMEKQRQWMDRIQGILKARTSYIVALCIAADSKSRARDWGFSHIVEGTGWDPESGIVPIDVTSKLRRTISAGCLSGAPVVGLPIVVVAMTRDEAVELHEHLEELEKNWGTHNLRPFHEIRPVLEPYRQAPVELQYTATREGWRPFPEGQQPVTMVLREIVDVLNSMQLPQLGGRRIKAQYYPFDELMSEEQDLIRIYRRIADAGCVVVLDEFSMLHPRLWKAYAESHLFTSQKVALVTVSPFDAHSAQPNQVLEAQLRRRLRDVFSRFMHEFDPQCELGVGNEYQLRRWLRHSLPEAVYGLWKPQPQRDPNGFWDHRLGERQDRGTAETLYSESG